MLTPRQHEALTVICSAVIDGKPVPSYHDIAHRIGANSKGFVHALINGLAERGFIAVVRHRKRSICPLKWPDGSAFDPNGDAKTRAIINSYENGRIAGRLGRLSDPNPCTGQHAVAWALGYKRGQAEREQP